MMAANWMPSYCHWNVRWWAQHSLTGWEMRWIERSSCRFWKVCFHHWMNQISDWKSSLDIAACDGCGCDCDCGGEFQLPDPDELSDLEKSQKCIIARPVKTNLKYLESCYLAIFLYPPSSRIAPCAGTAGMVLDTYTWHGPARAGSDPYKSLLRFTHNVTFTNYESLFGLHLHRWRHINFLLPLFHQESMGLSGGEFWTLDLPV